MKKKSIVLFIIIVGVLIIYSSMVLATDNTNKISISDTEIKVNGETISNNTSESVYLTNCMDNGGTSNEAKEANIEVANIINITRSGTYEIEGNLSDGQIAVNTNNINGDVIIVLNNANITCKNAPAIFVYNKETNSSTCNVIIKTAKDSENIISGAKIKQSVEGWDDQEQIIYNVEKNYSDEGEYFERYKYDGAISSDISLTFEGEGTLTIESNREGIEVKRDITINSGNYIFNSKEDGINAAADNESIITINGGTILINTAEDGEQGDGIDSNGYLYINGGTIYSFSNPLTEDSGLDSDLGIYINGGTIVATGNMYDEIKEESKQNSVTFQFQNKITKGTLIVIKDENNNIISAFKTNRDYKVITISTPNMLDENYIVYSGGEISGESENGLYLDITSYEGGTKEEATILTDGMFGKGMEKREFNDDKFMNDNNKVQQYYYYILIGFGIVVISLIVLLIVRKSEKGKKIIILCIGILTGSIITLITLLFMNKINTMNVPNDIQNMRMEEFPNMQKNGEIPNSNKFQQNNLKE